MPAIVDRAPEDGGEPVAIFESGAILIYLAEKTGKFLPRELRPRMQVLQWVMWQMGGLGPMAGQAHHFRQYARDPIQYAVDRYTNEVNRLYGVLDGRLEGREYLAGDYSIADMACWPWVAPYKRQGQDLDEFPNVKRWHETMKARPAVRRGMDVGKELRAGPPDPEAAKILFGQTAKSVRGPAG